MKLRLVKESRLPKLAWCAVLEADTDELVIHCGPWVEQGNEVFFEGAWDGAIDNPQGIGEATICAASGAQVSGEGALFFTPTHTLSHLQSVRKSGRLFLSNSLAFLLVASNEMYDEKYIFYEDDLNSSHMGLSKLKTRIPTSSGNEISLFYHCNILVDRELRISTVPKSAPGRFTDFASYYDFLVNGLRELAENANDASRCAKYRPLATISKGYDSTACAALSRQIDCKEAITFVDSTDPVDP